MIVRPWEVLSFNRNHHGLGYDKGNSFHIPDYSKPTQFVSERFLDENLKTPKVNEKVKNVDKFHHCH